MKNKFALITWIIILILVLWSLLNCSPQKKLHRLLKKHPELKQTETIYVNDTVHVVIPETKIDTVLSILQLRDTVFIQKDKLSAKLYVHNDSLYMNIKHDTIFKTVIREIPVKVDKIVYRRPRDGLRWYELLYITAMCLFVMYIVVTDRNKV